MTTQARAAQNRRIQKKREQLTPRNVYDVNEDIGILGLELPTLEGL